MVTIRPLRAADCHLLADLYPEKGDALFERYYLEHLRDLRPVWVAVLPDGELAGYVCLLWESPYTQFWRRNVPEIVDLNVIEEQRRQGIGSALIAACESAAQERGYRRIGISVVQDDPDYAAARSLYPSLGYEPDGFGITREDNERHLWKTLDS